MRLLVGGDPREVCPDWPVFPPLTDAGMLRLTAGVPKPMSAAAVGDAIGRLAAAAGIGGRIGGGSRRSAVVSSLGEARATRKEQQTVTGHRSAVVARYDRRRPGRIGTAARLGLSRPRRGVAGIGWLPRRTRIGRGRRVRAFGCADTVRAPAPESRTRTAGHRHRSTATMLGKNIAASRSRVPGRSYGYPGRRQAQAGLSR